MPNDIIITFETLYDLLRREKTRQELQEFDKNFYKNTAKYVEEKQSILESQKQKESVFAEQEIKKTRNQIENTLKILRELYETRENKIIQLALINSRTKSNNSGKLNLLPEELEFYDSIINRLNQFRSNILHNVQNSKQPISDKPKDIKTPEKPQNIKFIRFIEAVPKFVGKNLKTYGPFEKEDMASLPNDVSSILIKNKTAETI